MVDQDHPDDRLAEVERLLAELRRDNEELRARIDELAPTLAGPRSPLPATEAARAVPARTLEPAGEVAPTHEALSRRRMLGVAAGMAAAGAAGLVASAQPAAAANGQNVVLGTYLNTATQSTAVIVTGNPGYGLGAIDTSFAGSFTYVKPAVLGYAAGSALNTGGRFESDATYGSGVYAKATGSQSSGISVVSTGASSNAVSATASGADSFAGSFGSGQGTAAAFQSDHGQILLEPNNPGLAAPVDGTAYHRQGELLTDGVGDLWWCSAPGNPGTWRKLSGRTVAGALELLPAPVRVYDSRAGMPPHVAPQVPLAAGAVRAIDLRAASSGVPAGATAALVTCLIVDAAPGNANFTIWTNGVARPSANSIVWGGTSGRASGLTVTALDAHAKVQVSSSVKTDLAIDVVGFYR